MNLHQNKDIDESSSDSSFFGDTFSYHSFKTGSNRAGSKKGKRQHSSKGMRKAFERRV
jgi:hypothetical protein